MSDETTKLEVIEGGRKIVTLELIQRAVKDHAAIPIVDHYEPEIGGIFRIHALTGADMDKVRAYSATDSTRFDEWIAIVGCAEPAIGPGEWVLLGGLSPLVRPNLIKAILKHSGLTDDAEEEAKNASGETAGK